jgi:hypothetical protein
VIAATGDRTTALGFDGAVVLVGTARGPILRLEER